MNNIHDAWPRFKDSFRASSVRQKRLQKQMLLEQSSAMADFIHNMRQNGPRPRMSYIDAGRMVRENFGR